MASYRGIDVSNWSGYINWREVRDAGIEVAIIQASEELFIETHICMNFIMEQKKME